MVAIYIILLGVALILVGLLFAALPTAESAEKPGYRLPMDHCPEAEYGDPREEPCVWDARHQGNGEGHSLIVKRDGSRVFITHKRAHRIGEF